MIDKRLVTQIQSLNGLYVIFRTVHYNGHDVSDMGLTIYGTPYLIYYVSAISSDMMKSEQRQGSRTAKAEDHTYEGKTSNIPTAYMSRIETLSLIHRRYGHLPLSRLTQYLSFGRLKKK